MSSQSQSQAQQRPPQHQHEQPGRTAPMEPQPQDQMQNYKSAHRLQGKVAVITGGDSGIGRATAIGCAKEDADIAIIYLKEHEDAQFTKTKIEECGKKALLIPADVGSQDECKESVQKVVSEFGHIDILCNNAAEQHPQEDIQNIDEEQLLKTFQTNIFSMFYMAKHCLPHMKAGSSIINVASITAYAGNPMLLDYSSTKGAIVAFTRSLSLSLIEKNIRVNAVAPGPIWTPLIPSTFSAEKVATFGQQVPMKRAGQPDEVAPAIIFLASEDASYITGQTIHVNGGEIING